MPGKPKRRRARRRTPSQAAGGHAGAIQCFGERSALALIANRIVWIPYATATDWFRYQRERLHLEKEVAALQWGSSEGAFSNAVFFADAWRGGGALGVMLYSALLALTIKTIDPPLIAAASMPVWLACVSALTLVYFSGGLGFLLVLALALGRQPARADIGYSPTITVSEPDVTNLGRVIGSPPVTRNCIAALVFACLGLSRVAAAHCRSPQRTSIGSLTTCRSMSPPILVASTRCPVRTGATGNSSAYLMSSKAPG
ncbi:hypothetical protein [Bradyrhizobium sp. DASA03120]|uniref:hypothetical protein n=1 Tax=Bradyrhizobium sp. SMVTL-02 TaxID=3395917 RepID=UPI003F724095